MDHARVILAIALSFLVFMVWQFLFPPKEPVRKAEQSATAPSTSEEKIASEKPYAQQPETAKGAEAQPSVPAQKSGRTITVDTPLYRAEFSENGAAVKSFVLKKYREHVEKDSPLKQLVSPILEDGTVLLSFEQGGLPELKGAVYTAETAAQSIDVADKPQNLIFKWTAPSGVVVEKSYRFDPKTYLVGLTIDLKNADGPVGDYAQQHRPEGQPGVWV